MGGSRSEFFASFAAFCLCFLEQKAAKDAKETREATRSRCAACWPSLQNALVESLAQVKMGGANGVLNRRGVFPFARPSLLLLESELR
jgi:hypothetical protein